MLTITFVGSRVSSSRIDWCVNTIHDYFYKDGLNKVVEKDKRRILKSQLPDNPYQNNSDILDR